MKSGSKNRNPIRDGYKLTIMGRQMNESLIDLSMPRITVKVLSPLSLTSLN